MHMGHYWEFNPNSVVRLVGSDNRLFLVFKDTTFQMKSLIDFETGEDVLPEDWHKDYFEYIGPITDFVANVQKSNKSI